MKISQFPDTILALIHETDKNQPVIHKRTLKPGDVPDGYGAFFTVNGVSKERRKEFLSKINGIYCDLDFKGEVPEMQDLPIEWFETPPTIVNRTKNGYHCIWKLAESIDVTDKNREELITTFEGMNRWFVTNWGADNAAVDIARLLRIPGTEHRKDPADPFVITTVHEDTEAVYTREQLEAAFPPEIKKPEPVEYGELSDDMEGRLEKMLKRPKVAALWNGDTPDDQKSETDMALCCHLAFWLGKDPVAMDKAFLLSPKGQRDKVQSRPDYRKMCIDKAIAITKEVYTPKKRGEIDWDSLMFVVDEKTNKKTYLANDENIIRILDHYQVAKYDAFRNRAYVKVGTEWVIRDDGADGQVYSWLVAKFPFLCRVQSRKVSQMLTVVQYRNVFDSAQDYLRGLTWDGENRLDTWLSKVFYVEDDEYHRQIGRKWLMGMAARIMEPGRKFDNALIVQGGQKVGKSTVFLTLAGGLENHIEFTDLHTREMAQDMQGKLVVEFAEAAIFSKADSESLKSIVTRQSDTFRIPYEAHPRDFFRRCVFAVSANNDDILKDATGARRWWVVDLPEDMKVYPPQRTANITWLRANRDQMLAEAAHRVRSGEEFWEIDDVELKKRQKSITATEQDEDLFFKWYHLLSARQQNEGITIREAYCGAYQVDYRGETLNVETAQIKKADEMRVSRILTKIGLMKRKTKTHNLWVPGPDFDRNYEFRFQKTVHEHQNGF